MNNWDILSGVVGGMVTTGAFIFWLGVWKQKIESRIEKITEDTITLKDDITMCCTDLRKEIVEAQKHNHNTDLLLAKQEITSKFMQETMMQILNELKSLKENVFNLANQNKIPGGRRASDPPVHLPIIED